MVCTAASPITALNDFSERTTAVPRMREPSYMQARCQCGFFLACCCSIRRRSSMPPLIQPVSASSLERALRLLNQSEKGRLCTARTALHLVADRHDVLYDFITQQALASISHMH
eukprot:14111-Heterococcus_DN1.PRE.3